MKRNLIILASALVLAGCASPTQPGIKTVIQRVEVPIAVPCKVETPAKPDYHFDKITVENTLFEKVRAILADRKLRDAYEAELEAALGACK